MDSTITKAMKDTEIIVLARVLEIMEEHPTLAKQFIKQRYEELREEDALRHEK